METKHCIFAKNKGFCSNKNCKFLHPKDCKFDKLCNKKDCPFLHTIDFCHFDAKCTNKDCKFRHSSRKKSSEKCLKFYNGFCPDPLCNKKHPKPCSLNKKCTEPCHLYHTVPICFQQCSKFCSNRHIKEKNELTSLLMDESFIPNGLDQSSWRSLILKIQKALKDTKRALSFIDKKIDDKNFNDMLKWCEDDADSIETLNALKSEKHDLISQFESVKNKLLMIIKSEDLNHKRNRIYRELMRLETKFPSLSYREIIEKSIKESQVLIVKGSTGSGKSTQIPQYLAEMDLFDGLKIICTQPRKLAAMSLANRVKKEFRGKGLVKFVSNPYEKGPKTTKIEYLTEMTFLNILNKEDSDKTLESIGAIIVDEVHERNISTDILLGKLKSLLRCHPNLKVIVSSATLNIKTFEDFFGSCSLVEIPGRMYPVNVVYHPVGDVEDMVEHVVSMAVSLCKFLKRPGDILCFLTGLEDIERAKTLCENSLDPGHNVDVFILYGRQDFKEQEEVFKPTPKGRRKVIFSTNVAEASVTIPGVRHVIDSGLSKESVYDKERRITSLDIIPISKSSAEQRKGRAGRTAPGTCYRMYSEFDYNTMNNNTTPMVLSQPLGLTICTLYDMNLDPFNFNWIDHPGESVIQSTIDELKLLGALDKDHKLTDIGKIVSKLQIDPGYARMIYNACQSGLGEAACDLYGILSVGTMVFKGSSNPETRKTLNQIHKPFMNEYGDSVALYHLFQTFKDIRNNRKVVEIIENEIFEDKIRDSFRIYLSNTIEESDSDMSDDASSIFSSSDSDDEDFDSITTFDDDASSVSSSYDDVNEYKNKKLSVNQWCRQNALNSKYFFTANKISNDIKENLKNLSILKGDQSKVPSHHDIIRLTFDALLLNVAFKTKLGRYSTVYSDNIALIHPGSSLQQKQVQPELIVYQSVLQTSAVFLYGATALLNEDILHTSPEIYKMYLEKRGNILEKPIEYKMNIGVMSILLGRGLHKRKFIEKKYKISIYPNPLEYNLTIYCKENQYEEIKRIFDSKINEAIISLKDEVYEKPYQGDESIRIVFGEGCKVLEILMHDEYITLYINEVPLHWTIDDILRIAKVTRDDIRNYESITITNVKMYKITFMNRHLAKIACENLQGEATYGNTIQVTPYGVNEPSIHSSITGRFIVSFPIGKSKGTARIKYLSAMDANSVLDSNITLCKSVVPQSNKNNPNLPPLDDSLKRFKVDEENRKFKNFYIFLNGLSRSVDEFMIIDYLKRNNLPRPSEVIVNREDEENPLTLADELAFLESYKPDDFPTDITTTSFSDNKSKRAGFSLVHDDLDKISYLKESMENSTKGSTKYDQPIRFECQFTATLSIHSVIWEKFKKGFELHFQAMEREGINVPRVKHLHSRVNLRLSSDNYEKLKSHIQSVKDLIKFTSYQNPNKYVLFSRYGRHLLQKLSDEIYIHWDKRYNIIRIYGNEENQNEGKKKLDSLVNELSNYTRDERIIIQKKHVNHVKNLLNSFTESNHLVYFESKWNSFFLTGNSDSIEEVKEKLDSYKVNRDQSDTLCCICWCMNDGLFTLDNCQHGHLYCTLCIEFQTSDVSNYPLKCECCMPEKVMMNVKNIIKYVPINNLEIFEEKALEIYIRDSDEYKKCINHSCGFILKVHTEKHPNGSESKVGYCKECDKSYCLICSEDTKELVLMHKGMTCEEYINSCDEEIIMEKHMNRLTDLLNMRCPRCSMAYYEFSGCCAVTCVHCNAGFCGLCHLDCGDDAHAHVSQCRYGNRSGYFYNTDFINNAQNMVRLERIRNYINNNDVNNDMKVKLICKLADHVRDLNLDLTPLLSSY